MKVYKRSYAIKTLIFIAVLSIFGCSKLEEKIFDESIDTDLISDPNNAAGLVSPAYAQLRHLNEFWSYWSLQQACTDETMFPTRGTDWYDNGAWQQMHLHTWTANHTQIQGTWDAIVAGISRANTGLFYLNQFPKSAEI
ncbi:MAG: hypothetical protein P1P88_03700, partial [Bacteroidales bacterium]|nr:hypothetical protein [Bacteroidales bacterium]